jgi:predicted nucleic acid-binding protein
MTGVILDTCLVFEPKRPSPDRRVEDWFRRQDPYQLYLTATIVGELADGIARLPAGRRRADYRAWLDGLIETDFAGRIFAFDVAAALIYGEIVADALAQGRPPHVGDAQIAAMARRHDMAVATRNVGVFGAFGITMINPWDAT